jgi:MoaA/NifB/PqqE/SkfB family radical SAM enzyme
LKNFEINFGRACNNRCVFCSNGNVSADKRGWMRPDAIEKEIERGRKKGAESIGFIGGEPTLYPGLEKVISQAKEQGYQRISICTNGSRLADNDLLQRLIRAGLTRVSMSIHSHKARLEDSITTRPGSFAEKIAAIENLVAAQQAGLLNDGFSLNVVLHKKILSQLDSLVVFFRNLGVIDIRFNFIRPEYKAVGNTSWVPTFKQVGAKILQLIARNQAEFRMHITLADFPLCRLPWEILSNPHLANRYLGEVRDLNTDVALYSSASGQTQHFNWKDQRMSLLKCHLPSCDRCKLKKKCEGIWRGYLDIYGTEEFADGPTIVEACTAGLG